MKFSKILVFHLLYKGAECAKVPKMMRALQAGRPVPVPVVPNLAEGLSVPIVGANAFATIRGRLDRMVSWRTHSLLCALAM